MVRVGKGICRRAGHPVDKLTEAQEKVCRRNGMEYVKKRLAEIRPYENNPRINDGAVDDVVESIRQIGRAHV